MKVSESESKTMTHNDIREYYDSHPDLLLTELAAITGLSVPQLKRILMGG